MATPNSNNVYKDSGNFLEFLSRPNKPMGFTEFETGGKGTKPGQSRNLANKQSNSPLSAGLTQTGPAGDTATGSSADLDRARIENNFNQQKAREAQKRANSQVGNVGGMHEILAYGAPESAMRQYFQSFLTDGSNLDANNPFIQLMTRMANGLPFLYDAQGLAGGTGAEGFPDYMKSVTEAMRAPYSQDLASSPLYNMGELQGLISSLIGGNMSGDLAQDSIALALKSGDAQQAASMFMDMLASAGITAMTPTALNALMRSLQNDFQTFNDREATTAPQGAVGENAFWRFLQSNPLLSRYFGGAGA